MPHGSPSLPSLSATPRRTPPYALAPTTFRFAGLAALAGRTALGGQREVALAVYVVARLAHDVLVERGISRSTRAERAERARAWLSSATLPAAVRPALSSLVDASAADAHDAAAALGPVISVTATFLDAASRSELDRLATLLDAQALVR